MIRSFFMATAAGAFACSGASAVPSGIDTIAAGKHETPLTMQRQSHRHRVRPKRHLSFALEHRVKSAPLTTVATANREAVREPAGAFYMGAAQVYPWSEGALYRLYAAPEQISDIALEPGENLVSVAAGDTVRWVIGDTASGSAPARRVHILVKPVAADLETNLVIATDRRIYHVEAVSTERTAIAALSWSYPGDGLAIARAPAALPPEPVAAGIAVDQLNFDYRIEGDNVSWRPVRAFDDGHQVFIEFPPNIGEGEAPPLFVTGADGKAELTNYRLKGRYYIVDGLFAAAELRLGGKHQKVVRIRNESAGTRQRRPA